MTNFILKTFIENYENTSDAVVREKYGKLASIAGIISNFILFAIKMAVGIIFNSVSTTADAINNLSDSSSSVITLVGFKISGKPADKEHPYGHARMEYISGLIVSFLISFLGLQLIKSSVAKILNPVEAEFSYITIAVLTIAILVKLWQYFFYRKLGEIIKSSTLIATAVDSRNDILSTTAVLVGILITHFTGFNLDGYIGLIVAALIVVSGIKLIIDTVDPLLGTAPTNELVDYIYNKIRGYEGIVDIHDLQVHKYGESRVFATVHCEVPAEEDIMISHDIIDNIERDFLEKEGIHLVIHLDPVITSDEKTNKLKKKVSRIVSELSPELSMHDFRVVWGVSHSNLIFDVIVPYGFKLSEEQVKNIVSKKIKDLDPTYNSVITIDRDYVPK